jgi:hypothetical protein
MCTDYQLPLFGLVQTPLGPGILIEVTCPNNGLYFSPDLAEATVWWGTDNAVEDPVIGGKWIKRTFPLSSITECLRAGESK